MLKGIRLVTDSRPEHRNDITEANVRKREDAYVFGGIMAPRFDIDPPRDCESLPPAEGESSVGTTFVKQSCERISATGTRKVFLRVNYFRKPGQSGVNPQLPTTTHSRANSRVPRALKFTWLIRRDAYGCLVPSGMTVSPKTAASSLVS